MTSVTYLIELIRSTPDCKLYPPQDGPSVNLSHVVPADLAEFYQLCGGASLYDSSPYRIRIVSPSELVLANPVIFIGVSEFDLAASKGDISWSWYIIAEGDNSQWITIDLDPKRLGRCHDSFWDRHAMPGSSTVIATSFTDLLIGLLDNRGQHWYWIQPTFVSLGDAYDNLL